MSVSGLKQDLASLLSMGIAGSVTGVIVSDNMWKKLVSDSDGNFNGRIGISGVQGNRKIRYEFYVLESLTFPKNMYPHGYFFVPFNEIDYRTRILGHETDNTLIPRSCEIDHSEIKELNPLNGECFVHDRGIRYADFDSLIDVIKIGCQNGKSVHSQAAHFWHWGFNLRRPNEITWLKHPERYDYHRADRIKTVGRLLMRHTTDNYFEIVGIAHNGHRQIVEITENRLRFDDIDKFIENARYYFLPEEIIDFLSQFGIEVDPKKLELDPLYEAWKSQVDEEDIGRLKKYISSSGTNYALDLHIISGSFVGSRDVTYKLDLCDRIKGLEWEKLETEHFPKDWTGWPDTRDEKALKVFAESWVNE
jgi:hypothetical protein